VYFIAKVPQRMSDVDKTGFVLNHHLITKINEVKSGMNQFYLPLTFFALRHYKEVQKSRKEP